MRWPCQKGSICNNPADRHPDAPVGPKQAVSRDGMLRLGFSDGPLIGQRLAGVTFAFNLWRPWRLVRLTEPNGLTLRPTIWLKWY
jgi:hypothetical protein